MKYLFIILIALSSGLIGCKKNLELNPKGSLTTGSFYKNAGDAKAAVTACYSILRSVYSNEVILTPNEIMSDDAIPFLTGSADRLAIWNYKFVPSNTYIGQIWSTAYQGIQLSNIVISRIPEINMDADLQRQYVGEAKFLRALHYFNLVRFFGAVPIVNNETTSLKDINVHRDSVVNVYKSIETDLKDAETSLPLVYPASEMGRATKGAAKALLAKVYLTEAGNNSNSPYWAEAASKAKEVIDLNLYSLWTNYSDVYALKNRGGKESIFEVLFIADLIGNAFTVGYAPRGDPNVPGGSGFGIFQVSKSLFNSYTDNDKRKSVSFLTYFLKPGTGDTVHLLVDNPDPALAVSFWKLADITQTISGYQGGRSWPYMRYSEILLIYAEALNEANGPTIDAYQAINEVRNRAGLDPITGLSKDQFRDAVLNERRLELCFEGDRWFDLVRTGNLINAVKAENTFSRNANIQPFNTLLPIPQREMDADINLVQNPGY